MAKINSELVSQHLFKGWSDNNKSKSIKAAIEKTKKKVLIIDDNFNDFKDTFYEIIGKENIIQFFDDKYSVVNFKAEHESDKFSGCITRLNETLEDVCFVISDLYLIEDHGIEFFSTPLNAENISGFAINKEIKKLNPMIPVMMFTASNKVWNYRLFDSYGIDEWVVKFDSPLTNKINSAITKSFFENFEESILNLLQKKPYLFLMDIFKNINGLPQKVLWWDMGNNQKRKEIITIVNESLVAIKGLLNKQVEYEQLLADQKKIYGYNSYTCSAIVSQIGNIVEILYGLYEEQTNRNADSVEDGLNLFLLKNRNLAAHRSDYRDFTINDVVLSISLVNFILSEECPWNDFITRYKRPRGYITAKECSLPWLIIQLYNMNYAIPSELKKLLNDRVKSYLDSAFLNPRTKAIDINKMKWFKNFMKSEYTLARNLTIQKGTASYNVSEKAGKLIVELSIPN